MERLHTLFVGMLVGFVIGAVLVLLIRGDMSRVEAAGNETQKVKIEGVVEVKIVGPVANGKPVRIEFVD